MTSQFTGKEVSLDGEDERIVGHLESVIDRWLHWFTEVGIDVTTQCKSQQAQKKQLFHSQQIKNNMNIVQVKFPFATKHSLNLSGQKSTQENPPPKKRSNIAKISSHRKLIQQEQTNLRIKSDRPNLVTPKLMRHHIFEEDNLETSQETRTDDRLETHLPPPPTFKISLKSRHQEQTPKVFPFTSLGKLQPQPPSSPKLAEGSRNLFFDDDVNTNYQNNILKAILNIKRNTALETNQKLDRNGSMPRIQDRSDDFSYFRVLKLPHHWNDNYYQTQRLLRDAKAQQQQPQRDTIHTPQVTVASLHRYREPILTKHREPAVSIQQKGESPRLFYGELVSPVQSKLNPHTVELEAFDDEKEAGDDYFHYYVQSQKRK